MRNKLPTLLLFVLILFGQGTAAQAADKTEEDPLWEYFASFFHSFLLSYDDFLECKFPERNYQDSRNIIDAIQKDFPTDEWFYIGLGRSPSSIIAGLQVLNGEHTAMNLPFSGPVDPHNDLQQDVLEEHVSTFLKQAPTNKKWLFIDYINQCKGMCSFANWFQIYKTDHPGTVSDIHFWAMSRHQSGYESPELKKMTASVTVYSLLDELYNGKQENADIKDTLLYAFDNHGYDYCSEYGQFKSDKFTVEQYQQIDFDNDEHHESYKLLKQQWNYHINQTE